MATSSVISPERCDLLVHNARLLTVNPDDTIIPGGAMAVRSGRIFAVGADDDIKSRFVSSHLVDANGGVVHPGMIDAHMHVSQYTARSVRSALAARGLTQGHWKAEIRPEDEHSSAALAAIEYLRSGFTGFVDPGTIFEPDAVVPVADEVGIRIWLTDPYVADNGRRLAETLGQLTSDGFLNRWPKSLDDALMRLGGQLFRNSEGSDLVRAYVGIYGEGTESLELHRAAVDLAKENHVQFQMHLGYLPSAQRAREKELGRSLYRHYAREGLLHVGVTFIHANVVRPDEVGLFAETGIGVVWCPFGQLHMLGEGGAEPRMAALQRARVPVGLGTDIPWVINFDQLAGMAIAASSISGETVSATEVLRALTIGGAAAVGAAHETGSLEAGKHADFVVRYPNLAGDYRFDDPLEGVIHGGRETVRSVYIAGQLVLDAGEPVRVESGAAIENARQSARGIAARVGLL